MNKRAAENIRLARESGDGRLPHEILLHIARGNFIIQRIPELDETTGEIVQEKVKLLVPTLADMTDCAKAAAPYFAPKISTVEVISGVSDDQLDELIARAAAEAGISLAPCGEGETDPDEGAAGRSVGRRRVDEDDPDD